MCVVSMIMDDWQDRWRERPWYPYIPPQPTTINPHFLPPLVPPITREEFDKLKNEVEILKQQIVRAKEYDIKHNEPDCEIEEKIAKIREIAKLVGINLDEILEKKK